MDKDVLLILRYSQEFPDIDPPAYAHIGDAGFDLRAAVPEEGLLVDEFGVFDVPTGLRFDLPHGWELQIRPRSGLSKYLTVVNAPGTIDSAFRGEVKVRISARPGVSYTIQRGERIAQAVLAPIYRAGLIQVAEITSDTERGEGGFGSTGRV